MLPSSGLFTVDSLPLARVFVPGRLFHLSLLFVGKAMSLPLSGTSDRCFSRVARMEVADSDKQPILLQMI